MIYQKVQSSQRLLPQHAEVLDSQSRHHLNFSKHGKPRFSVAFAVFCVEIETTAILAQYSFLKIITYYASRSNLILCKTASGQSVRLTVSTTMNNECRRNTCTPISGFPTSILYSRTSICPAPYAHFWHRSEYDSVPPGQSILLISHVHYFHLGPFTTIIYWWFCCSGGLLRSGIGNVWGAAFVQFDGPNSTPVMLCITWPTPHNSSTQHAPNM